MAEHSPTPWTLAGRELIAADDFIVAFFPTALDKPNAAFIARAVNSHDDLVAACRAMLHACEGIEENYEEDTNEYSFAHRAAERGRAALAKATGGNDAKP